MKDSVLQRIRELYEAKKFKSERQFALATGLNQKSLNQQLNGQRALSLDTVLAVLSSFDDISAEWLLRGRGEMMNEDNMKNSLGGMLAKMDDLHAKYSILQEMYADKCAEIARLRKE